MARPSFRDVLTTDLCRQGRFPKVHILASPTCNPDPPPSEILIRLRQFPRLACSRANSLLEPTRLVLVVVFLQTDTNRTEGGVSEKYKKKLVVMDVNDRTKSNAHVCDCILQEVNIV